MARAIEAVKDRELRAQLEKQSRRSWAQARRRGARRSRCRRGGAPFGIASGPGRRARRARGRPRRRNWSPARGCGCAACLRRWCCAGATEASAEVEAGPLRMKVPLSEIIAVVSEEARQGAAARAARRERAAGRERRARARASGVTVHTAPADRETGGAKDEINVIGCTVEEATRRVDKFLDNAALAGKAAGAHDSRARHGRAAARPGGVSVGASAGGERSRRSGGSRRARR